ncbi:MAG: hypothetical protein M1470_02980 [Bacteroidetes bacterium]|nr:hypothetical protein [Bacteroidota bacterium]MCL5739226.1 hypothetical protein [Bacteroidota bacterium]
MSKESLQLVKTQSSNENPYPIIEGNLKVRNLKAAKRLMSKLIEAFIAGRVTGNDAKTLAYLTSTYIEVAQAADLEDRLIKLETKLLQR